MERGKRKSMNLYEDACTMDRTELKDIISKYEVTPVTIVKGIIFDDYLEFSVYYDGVDLFTLKNKEMTINLYRKQIIGKIINHHLVILSGGNELIKALQQGYKEVILEEKHEKFLKELSELYVTNIEKFYKGEW
jgi:uncharacterized membrane protein